jgi:putative transposase
MKFDSQRHRRRSIRLRGFDYSQPGAYFVTVCTKDRAPILGSVDNWQMHLNEFGSIVRECWCDLPNHYPYVQLDEFVLMPNHIHGILIICPDVGAGSEPAPTPPITQKRHGLPEIIRSLKTFSARRINELRGTPDTAVWQRNYWEHIIRNGKSLDRIRAYISTNAERWHLDRENPERTGVDEIERQTFALETYTTKSLSAQRSNAHRETA